MAIKKITYHGSSKVISRICEVVNELIDGGGGGGSSTLAGLTDVSLTSPTDKQTIKYNSTSQKWENADELQIVHSSTVITSLNDIPINSAGHIQLSSTISPFTESSANMNVAYICVGDSSGRCFVQVTRGSTGVTYINSTNNGTSWSGWLKLTPDSITSTSGSGYYLYKQGDLLTIQLEGFTANSLPITLPRAFLGVQAFYDTTSNENVHLNFSTSGGVTVLNSNNSIVTTYSIYGTITLIGDLNP